MSADRGRIRPCNWLLAVWLANPGLGPWSAPEPTPTPERPDSAAVRTSVEPRHRLLKQKGYRSAPRSSRHLLHIEADDWIATGDPEDDVVFKPLYSSTATHEARGGRLAGPVAGARLRLDAPWSQRDRVAPLRC